MFSDSTVPRDSKGFLHKTVCAAISGAADIPEVLGCRMLQQMSSQRGLQNITSRIVV